jgi:hypothetical protein
MSAKELEEFLAAMELVRQANAAFACAFIESDDDLDEDSGAADSLQAVTFH